MYVNSVYIYIQWEECEEGGGNKRGKLLFASSQISPIKWPYKCKLKSGNYFPCKLFFLKTKTTLKS